MTHPSDPRDGLATESPTAGSAGAAQSVASQTAPGALPTASGARIRTALRELLRPHRGLAVAGIGVLTAATAVGLLTAPLLGRVVDLVAAGRSPSALTAPVLALVLVAVLQGVGTALGVGQVARLGELVLARLRERFVARALRIPLGDLERAGSGDLTSRVTNDVSVIGEAVREALPELARSVLTIGLTLVGLAVLDWRFLVAALLAAPIQLHTVRWYVRRALPLYATQRISVGAQQHRLLDAVGGAATVRAFRLAPRQLQRVTDQSAATMRLNLDAVRLRTRFYSRLNLAEFVGLAAVLTAGFFLVRDGHVSIGTAAAAALYFHNLFGPLNAALALVDDAQQATASLARLVGVADLPAEPTAATPAPAPSPAAPAPSPATSAPAAPAPPTVQVTGLRYAYRPGQHVLHGVDLRLSPGERVAVVGASGAGKTTLAKLVAGVHRPTGGSVRLGDADLADLDPATIRRTVALITQEVHVFAGPLADDLRLARPEATEAELRAVLDRVGALGWATALPDGLATVVGEGGHRLTVAQAQQLALARLVLADPPIAILDEATAEAGSAGARLLEAAATAATAGRTALIVAHRLTQAALADRIVVLDAGRVVETGTHEELAGRPGGRYAALWSAWSDRRPATADVSGTPGGSPAAV